MSPEDIIRSLDKIAQATIIKRIIESKEFKKNTEQFAFDMLMDILACKLDNNQIVDLINSLYAIHGLNNF